MTWLPTYTGKVVDLLDPRPEQIDLADIAIGLAGIPRYYRQSQLPWTVAEHSVLVADAVYAARTLEPKAQVYALLHDAHEAYMGDIIAPLKHILKTETNLIERIEEGLDRAIYTALELESPGKEMRALIREHDLRALVTERRDLLGPQKRLWSRALDDVRPYEHVTLVPDPSEARRRETWLTALRDALRVASASAGVLQLVRDAQDVCRAVPDPGY